MGNEDNKEVVHRCDELEGLYGTPLHTEANSNWKVGVYPITDVQIDRLVDAFQLGPKEVTRLKRIWPTKVFYPGSVKYIHRKHGVKVLTNQHVHLTKISEFLAKLYESGILYKRKNDHTLLIAPGISKQKWENGIMIDEIVTKRRIPNRVTGKIFLVNKNAKSPEECRLVIDFSQFSRYQGKKYKYPHFFLPSQTDLIKLLRTNEFFIGLDLTQAFYQIPLHPDAAAFHLVSDGTQVYAWRKLPMGTGISTFALHMFVSTMLSSFRRRFPACSGLSYADDILLTSSNRTYLSSAAGSFIRALEYAGGAIKADKANPTYVDRTGGIIIRTSATAKFIGVQINRTKLLLHDSIKTKLKRLFEVIHPNILYDYKICQKLLGLLGYVVPFTNLTYCVLKPLYFCASRELTFSLHPTYFTLLRSLASCFVSIQRRERAPQLEIFTDASYTALGFYDRTHGWSRELLLQPADHYAIHHHELSAVLKAVYNGYQHIATDSMFVHHKKFQSYGWLLGHVITLFLRSSFIYYVHTSNNPSDVFSRSFSPTLQRHSHFSFFSVHYYASVSRQRRVHTLESLCYAMKQQRLQDRKSVV